MSDVDSLEALELLEPGSILAFDHGLALRCSDGHWDVLWNDEDAVTPTDSQGLWGVSMWLQVRWAPGHVVMTDTEVLRALVWADFIGNLLDRVSAKKMQQKAIVGDAPVFLDADVDVLELLRDCYAQRGIPLE